MEEIDSAALARRLVKRFLDAWPECDESVDSLIESVDIHVRPEPNGEPMIWASIHGNTIGLGFDGTLSGATEAVDSVAELAAWDAEHDRWVVGDGWLEYRPPSIFDDALDRLLRLVREHVCATAMLVGETIVADGELRVDGATRVGSLTIAGTALAESLRHHPDAATAAGAVLSDVEEALHFAALDGGAILIAIG